MKNFEISKTRWLGLCMAFLVSLLLAGCGSKTPVPVLASITPNSGAQGQTLSVTLTGTNFTFGPTIQFSGAGITASSTTLVSSTEITATFTIAATAALGPQNITVETTNGTSGAVVFTVTTAGPSLTSISPVSGLQGQIVDVTLTGTNFLTGATIALSGTGITVSGTTVVSSTDITATFTIAADAAPGDQSVTVTTSAGTSGPVTFTVISLAPTLSSIVPSSGLQGQSVPVILTGTNLVAGATIAFSGTGITASGVTVVSGTQIDATFAIAANTTPGAQNVTVTTVNGSSNAVAFTVTGLLPTVSSTQPANLAIDVPINRQITATFNKPMNPATISTATFTVASGGSNVTGVVTYDATNNVALFAPTTSLTANTVYTATITSGATDTAGNPLVTVGSAPNPWTFTTGTITDVTAPTVSATNPASGATAVPINQSITATFSEAMNSTTITTTTFTVLQGVTAVAGTVTYAGMTATFTPSANFAANTVFTATITTGATDLAGNPLGTGGSAPNPWSFTTGATADTSAPTVTLTNPANAATAVPLNASISATFSKAMNPFTITTGTFMVTGPGGTAVNGAVSYDPSSEVATFTPQGLLTASATYTATITTGVADLEGNLLASGTVPNPWTFTTGTMSAGQAPVNLGSASNFAVLAGSTITSAGPTIINGDLGVSPGTAVTGFPPGSVNGTIYLPPDPTAGLAETDLTTAYNDAAGRTTNVIVQPTGELGGLTLPPGLYQAPAGSFAITSLDLTLDAQGDPNAVWIFQMPSSTLTVGNGRQVILIGGAQAANIYWQVGSSATLGTTVIFKGNILASQSITLQTGATLDGRALTQVAAVTLDSNTVTTPGP